MSPSTFRRTSDRLADNTFSKTFFLKERVDENRVCNVVY